jgi:hypothetical protein
MTSWSDEETDDPHYADRRNFYKVEKWSRDGLRVEQMLYAGNNLDKARRIFERTVKQRPRFRLTIRQRMRVLDEWPRGRNDPLTGLPLTIAACYLERKQMLKSGSAVTRAPALSPQKVALAHGPRRTLATVGGAKTKAPAKYPLSGRG